jgi:hypothetical protein
MHASVIKGYSSTGLSNFQLASFCELCVICENFLSFPETLSHVLVTVGSIQKGNWIY